MDGKAILKPCLVSVIMTNYNTPEEYLRAAMESILSQTYSNIEFIVVDDGSTYNSRSVIESYQDDRIIFIQNEKNLGITKSLNIALARATGEFVARMDADDISLPQRLERQVQYMSEHPEVVVCGTYVNHFGDKDLFRYKQYCLALPDRQEMQIRFLFNNYARIVHPTAMFRHAVLIEHGLVYNEAYPCAQDYRMWIDCCRIGACTNVPEILLHYRYHKSATSSQRRALQLECDKRIIDEQLSWLGLKLPDGLFDLHYGFLAGRSTYDPRLYAWLRTIIRKNNRKKVFDPKKMKTLLMSAWTESVYFEIAKAKGFNRIKPLLHFPPSRYYEFIRMRIRRRRKFKKTKKTQKSVE